MNRIQVPMSSRPLPGTMARDGMDAESPPRQVTPEGRPWSVTVAAGLLWTQLVWSAAVVLIAVADWGVIRDVMWVVYGADPSQDAARAATAWVVAVAIVASLTAALFAGLAVAVLRGSDTGQLLATIAAGLAIAAYGCAGLTASQMDGQPEWFRTSMTALAIAAVAAMALLQIPASNRYFRSPMVDRREK